MNNIIVHCLGDLWERKLQEKIHEFKIAFNNYSLVALDLVI